MNYKELDTPSLIINKNIMLENIKYMQDYANRQGVALRPHTKTSKMPYVAKIQRDHGCSGITVAKVGEAMVMAENGLDNIFIANEIVGEQKLKNIRKLAETIDISFAVDTPCQVEAAEKVFEGALKKAQVLIEIEVGENRSGIIEESDFMVLLESLKKCKNVHLKGIFSHEGHSYNAQSKEDCFEKFEISEKRTLHFVDIAREQGFEIETVSIGATPSLMQDFPIMEGITEIRPGTYVFMDASMASTIGGDLSRCAATILTTVISRPTPERVITDVGAKGITAQKRQTGISACEGLGTIKSMPDVHIFDVYDEHAIIYNKEFRDLISVGDKVEIIPVHICPVCNLHENAYFVDENGEVVDVVPVQCRGKLW